MVEATLRLPSAPDAPRFLGAALGERALTLLGGCAKQRRIYDLRAYALALAVLSSAASTARVRLRQAHAGWRAAAQQPQATTRAYLAIGRMQRRLGQLANAEWCCSRRTLAADDELGDLEAEVRLHLAKVHQIQGRHLEALQELQLAQGERRARRPGPRRGCSPGSAISTGYSAPAARSMTFYTRALSIEQGRGSLFGQAILRDKLALALLNQNS
jgi:hypothetical protein